MARGDTNPRIVVHPSWEEEEEEEREEAARYRRFLSRPVDKKHSLVRQGVAVLCVVALLGQLRWMTEKGIEVLGGLSDRIQSIATAVERVAERVGRVDERLQEMERTHRRR